MTFRQDGKCQGALNPPCQATGWRSLALCHWGCDSRQPSATPWMQWAHNKHRWVHPDLSITAGTTQNTWCCAPGVPIAPHWALRCRSWPCRHSSIH